MAHKKLQRYPDLHLNPVLPVPFDDNKNLHRRSARRNKPYLQSVLSFTVRSGLYPAMAEVLPGIHRGSYLPACGASVPEVSISGVRLGNCLYLLHEVRSLFGICNAAFDIRTGPINEMGQGNSSQARSSAINCIFPYKMT